MGGYLLQWVVSCQQQTSEWQNWIYKGEGPFTLWGTGRIIIIPYFKNTLLVLPIAENENQAQALGCQNLSHYYVYVNRRSSGMFLATPLSMSEQSSATIITAKTSPAVEVRVTFVGPVQRLVGRREVTVGLPQETTLGGLLQELVARYGEELGKRLLENGELASHVTVLINGYNALTRGGLMAKFSDGSQSDIEIVLLGPPLMGG